MNFRNIEAAAVLLYGALTLVLVFTFAAIKGSDWGMALAATAAGLTYVFQAVVLSSEDDEHPLVAALQGLQLVIICLTIASGVVTFIGA